MLDRSYCPSTDSTDVSSEVPHEYMRGKDMFILPDGSTYHLGAKEGEVYERVVVVGSVSRAGTVASLLDRIEVNVTSSRGFQIFSGTYKGVRVSVVAIGMGSAMMDFFVRESSIVCRKPMAVIRVGTCGLFAPDLSPGCLVTAGQGCCAAYINQAAFAGGDIEESANLAKQYLVTKPVNGCSALNDLLLKHLQADPVCAGSVKDGVNISADTFFACQGRASDHFDNGDSPTLFDTFKKANATSCEMETFTLFQLAKQRTIAPLYAAACHIGVVNRVSDTKRNITDERLHALEESAGEAALNALVNFTF